MAKKIIRLTESDLMRIINRVIKEEKYGSFGNLRRKDYKGDQWIDDMDRIASDDEIYGIGGDEDFDTEEFDDFESYSKRYPEDKEDTPTWFKGKQGKTMFDTYRKTTGKPFKVKTRKPRMD